MKKHGLKRALSAIVALAAAFVLLISMSGCSLFISGDIMQVETTEISGAWKLARVPDISEQGSALSKKGYSYSDKWIDATVPGTALVSYYNDGLIDDPYYSDNMLKLDESYYNVDYWYRTEFTVPASYSGRRVMLNFDGINWKADIYVNGKSVGSINGAFIRGQFDVTDCVTVGEQNSLAVYIHWCNADIADMPTFLCSAGWDWMPPIPGRNVGIQKKVYLSASGGVTVDNPYIKVDLNEPDYNKASVTITTGLTNHTDRKISGTVVGTIRSKNGKDKSVYKFQKSASVEAGETVNVDVASLTMNNPDLWWPNGLGDQNLYTMNIYFKSGDISDSEDVQFGVREFSYEYEPRKGSDETPDDDMIVNVNGERVYCRGGNWGIFESMLNWTEKDFYNAVKLSAEEGFTMIRFWHGTSGWDAFYDAADELGILVWEEFWGNGSTAPSDKKMFMANVDDTVKRLRNRASLCVWCGENEAYHPFDIDIKVRFQKNSKKLLDDTRIFISASNKEQVTGGITYQINDLEWYFTNGRNRGFTTEYGCVNIWNVESMRNFIPESELQLSRINSDNEIWSHHEADRDAFGNKQFEKYVNEIYKRYGSMNSDTCKNIEDFCRNAQLLNYETFKAMFESWNYRMFEKNGGTSGALLWMSQQGWPGVVWSTYDYYMEENGAFFGCRSANEAVHVQYNYDSGDVYVINNTLNTYQNAKISAEVYNMDGTKMFECTEGVYAPKSMAVKSFCLFDASHGNLKNNSALSSVYFIRLKLTDSDGNLLSENFYWRGKQDQRYSDLKNLGTASYSFEASKNDNGTSTVITLKVTNSSDKVAFAARVKAMRDNAKDGEDNRILPTYYSDNYFTLMPGESKTITLEYDNEYLYGGKPQISVQAYNTGDYVFAVN